MFAPRGRQELQELRDPTLHFHHDDLTGPDTIRLIELLPGSWEEDVQCNIHTVGLNALPEFDALSYSWGDDLQDDPAQPTDFVSTLEKAMNPVVGSFFRCNGKLLPISTNLYNALRRLREKSIKNLWVDRICIDQSNLVERSDQVGKMGEIYSRARFVAVWLGEEDDYTIPAFDLIEKLSDLATGSAVRSLHTNPSLILDPDAMQALGLPSFPSTEWKSMHSLFERRWFQRAWVIQEVALAKVALAICGCRIINWDDIGRTGQYLVATGFFRTMQATYGIQGRPTFASSIQNSRAGVKLDADRSLATLLCSMRRFKATDPRDKIYSLLDLARTKGDQTACRRVDQSVIYPDYTSSVETVFHQATKNLIEQEESLALLSTVEDAHLTRTPNLASWVPDYAVWQEVTILGFPDNPHDYHAGGDQTVSIFRSDPQCDNLTLSLTGYRVDTVNEVGICLNGNSMDDDVPKALISWLGLIDSLPETYSTGESRDEVIWRTFIGNFGGATNPAHSDYSRHFLAFLSQAFRDDKDNFHKAIAIVNSVASLHPREGSTETWNWHLYATSFVYIAGLRRLFVTKNGYIGLGSKSVQAGDNVFVFPGGMVPLILRPSEQGIYRLVGEAYVHGIMNGEAVNVPSRTLTPVNIR